MEKQVNRRSFLRYAGLGLAALAGPVGRRAVRALAS